MSTNKEFLRQISFRAGLVLVVMGGLIYLGGGSRSLGAASIGDAWLGMIVTGLGVIVLGVHVFLNRSN